MGESFERYYCKMCRARVMDKAALVEHLREEHELLESLSYAASTMIAEEDRDGDAERSFNKFEQIRREMGESKK